MQSTETDWLHGLRGLALLIVVAGHLPGINARLIPIIDLAGTAKTGVWLFFVLSAYLLSRPLTDEMKSGPVAALSFYVRRVFRILPLYVVVIFYLVEAGHMSAGQGWRHVFFLRGDFAFWTMPVEMTFYLVLPALAAFAGLRIALSGLLISIAAYLLAEPMLLADNTTSLLNYLVFFALGAVVSYLPAPTRYATLVAATGCCIMALANAKSLSAMTGLSISQALVFAPITGLGCAMLLYGSIGSRPFRAMFSNPIMAWLGRVSFGAYLIHYHLMLSFAEIPINPSLKGIVVFAAIVAVATVAHFMIEKPMNDIGHRLSFRLQHQRKQCL